MLQLVGHLTIKMKQVQIVIKFKYSFIEFMCIMYSILYFVEMFLLLLLVILYLIGLKFWNCLMKKVDIWKLRNINIWYRFN